MRNDNRWLVVGVASGLLFLGCGKETTGPAERFQNELVSIDESQIHASADGDDLVVSFPLTRVRESGVLSGRIQASLIDISHAEPASLVAASVVVNQDAQEAWHTITFRGSARGLERPESAAVLIDWRVADVGRKDLYGKRSLFSALGDLDVQLRGPTELSPSGDSPLRVLVRDPQTSAVLAGASVKGFIDVPGAAEGDAPTSTELFSGISDERGEFAQLIGLPEGVRAGTLRVVVATDDAEVWTSRAVTLREDGAIYLGSDKTIYKPGQNIHLRMLALDSVTRAPVADQETVFEAKDARGNKVFHRATRTDAFGVASLIVPTDTRINEGEWSFSASVSGRTAQLKLPVEAYTLPKMRIDLTTDAAYALPGDVIRGELDAGYLFGEPVANAYVALQATTQSGVFVGNISGTTNAEGKLPFTFTIPASLNGSALEAYGDTLLISAEVTDTAEQVEQGSLSLALAAAPIRLQFVSEATGETARSLFVVVTDAVGRPLRATVTASASTIDSVETSESGVAELFIPADAPSTFVVSATDGASRSHERTFDNTVAGGGALVVSTDKALYTDGETASVRVTAPAGVSRIFVDVYRGAEGILSTAADVADGVAEIALPISDERSGLLLIDAMAVKNDGTTLRGSKPLLVEREDKLRIELLPGRETYVPGEEAELNVRVTDASGAPTTAALGLSVVDEAVFALGGEPKNTLRGSFGLDSRVLPRSLQVAGYSADDLGDVADDEARAELARVLFASAGQVHGPNFDFNSIADEMPRVRASLTARLNNDAEKLIARASLVAVGGTVPSVEMAKSVVARLTATDPFGVPYRISTGGTYEWDLVLNLASSGPDETADTADDVAVSSSLHVLFYSGRGDDRDFAFPEAAAGGVPVNDQNAGEADPITDGGGAEPTRVRKDFRETVYINPTLITDASGRARVVVPLADSITTWRVSADGSTQAGQLGSARQEMRTFQSFFVDFNVPANATSGDVVELPAIVYNYLDETKTVAVSLEADAWFELISDGTQNVTLGPSEVRSAKFKIRLTRAGEHALSLRATTGGVSDALTRSLKVAPEGQPESSSVSGQLAGRQMQSVTIPSDTTEGGSEVQLVLTPGFVAEAVQGIESLMQEPNGCFEQTTSSAWPNTLVANYLEETGQMTDEKREEIVGLVTRGYQRLLTFESPTGGFNWWGDSDPGNRILSAIMLWHLKDLQSLITIDDDVRTRTLTWLLAQQNADGSFEAGDALHAGNEVLGTDKARTTAFIAWALGHTAWADDAVSRANGWLSSHLPDESDLYANALAANSFAIAEPTAAAATTLFARLDRAKEARGVDGYLWPTATPSWTGGAGDAVAIETTGLVAYAMMTANTFSEDAEGAMRFITANKDAVGTWYNTQATMNALRALSAAASGRGVTARGTLRVRVNGVVAEEITVTDDNAELYRSFDLTRFTKSGANNVELELVGTGELSYRLSRTAYRPVMQPALGPLSLSVSYDATEVEMSEAITATVHATNNDVDTRDQVIVQIGRAPGFDPRTEDLEWLKTRRVISRYEVRATDITFYLMNLTGGESRELTFRVVPSIAGSFTAPSSEIYSYYETALKETLPVQLFSVGYAGGVDWE